MTTSPLKVDVFQAVADPTRRTILKMLDDREMAVTVISGHFAMTRTAVSKHLRILVDAGLLEERRVGRETRYKLQPEPLHELQQWLSYFERFWDNKLAMLQHYVERDRTDQNVHESPKIVNKCADEQ